MAQFAKATFSAASYAAFRPSYPPSLYNTVLAYHNGPQLRCVDLGCGHGVVAKHLSTTFDEVIGTDPSDGMIEQARSSTPKGEYSNVTYRKSSAESLPFIENECVDLVVAGQSSHWFDAKLLWPEMKRITKKGGTLAFWGYKDHVFVDYPKATKILNEFAHGDSKLGPYWSQPGRSRVENKLREISPPASDWEDVERIEYEPGTKGPRTGEGTMFVNRRMKIGQCMDYIRTWSAFSAWQDEHQQDTRAKGDEIDIVDEMFESMRSAEPEWQSDESWQEKEVELEWGSALLLARRK